MRVAAMIRKRRITPVHTTSYIEAGSREGPALVFVHGWPGLAITWRHQIDYFCSRGYRVIAPDTRGYGSSTIHKEPSAYRQELVVMDMIGLLDHLGLEKAIWVGHDWGSATVWNIAAHFPERCTAAITLDVPFRMLEHGFPGLLLSIDRDLYPAES
jgi:soluble epoxide hydrolase / lipid-phosphate phosphatase